jgi:hypothetical protein
MLEFELELGEFSSHFQNSKSPNIREFEYEFELGEFFPTPLWERLRVRYCCRIPYDNGPVY